MTQSRKHTSPTTAPAGPVKDRRKPDVRLARALREIEVARAELNEMALRAIVAAESVTLISTLVTGPNGDAIHEVADMVLEACTLADVIGQRLTKVGDSLSGADRTPPADRDGVVAAGPGLTPISQKDVDAIFG